MQKDHITGQRFCQYPKLREDFLNGEYIPFGNREWLEAFLDGVVDHLPDDHPQKQIWDPDPTPKTNIEEKTGSETKIDEFDDGFSIDPYCLNDLSPITSKFYHLSSTEIELIRMLFMGPGVILTKRKKWQQGICIASRAKVDGKYIFKQEVIPMLKLESFLKDFAFEDGLDYYILNNTIAEFNHSRKNQNVRFLHNVVFDIDQEKHHDYSDIEALTDKKKELATYLRSTLPYLPSAIIMTGGGLQLWYSCEELYNTSENFETAERARKILSEDIRDAIEKGHYDKDFTLDNHADCCTHLCRLPGSIHTGTKRKNEVLYADLMTQKWRNPERPAGHKYDEIEPRIGHEYLFLSKRKRAQHGAKKAQNGAKREKGINTERLEKRQKETSEGKYEALLYKRKDIIEKLVQGDYLGQEGTREITLFMYHNIVRQIYTEEQAKSKTYYIATLFADTMTKDEVDATGIWEEKIYYYTIDTFEDTLSMTKAIREELDNMALTRHAKSNFSRDIARAQKKAERNATIVTMARKGMTMTQIAKATGVSRQTVAKVIKGPKQEIKTKETLEVKEA